jgi:hypothetical protein
MKNWKRAKAKLFADKSLDGYNPTTLGDIYFDIPIRSEEIIRWRGDKNRTCGGSVGRGHSWE